MGHQAAGRRLPPIRNGPMAASLATGLRRISWRWADDDRILRSPQSRSPGRIPKPQLLRDRIRCGRRNRIRVALRRLGRLPRRLREPLDRGRHRLVASMARSLGHGTRGHTSRPGIGHALDSMQQVECSGASRSQAIECYRIGSAGGVSLLRAHARAVPRSFGSATRAAFLSARNDAIANVAIIIGGPVTAFVWPVVWPDLIVGFGIGTINVDAARAVWTAAIREHSAEA
jgi:hypothetical protein